MKACPVKITLGEMKKKMRRRQRKKEEQSFIVLERSKKGYAENGIPLVERMNGV